MKKLVLLLSALLVLSSLASSPVFAARPSAEHRFQVLLASLYQYMFPFAGAYQVRCMPGDILPWTDGGDTGSILSGDADDYGNGRSGGTSTDTKPKALRDVLPGPEQGPCGKGIIDKTSSK